MNSVVSFKDGKLEVSHLLELPPSEAFTWWSRPEKLERWSGCAEARRCEIKMDFRVGGSFRQTMEIAGKGSFSFHGVYDEIVEPRRIAWRAFFGPMTSRVVVEFIPAGECTRVVLTQTGFPDERSLKTIQKGTEESFSMLLRILADGPKDKAP